MSDVTKAPKRPPPPTAEQIAASRKAQAPHVAPPTPAAPAAPAIPPARLALTAGDPLVVPEYDRGRVVHTYDAPAVIPLLSRPMDTQMPTMVPGITIRPARDMDAGAARATWAKIVADTKVFAEDFPHALTGEDAHALNFFRALITRQKTRTDATLHGQEVADDPVQAAQYLPPPEQLKLQEIAGRALLALRIYHIALLEARVSLSDTDRHTVDTVLGELQLVLPSPG